MSDEKQELAARNHRTTIGFWLYLMTDSLLFASLFAVYIVLKSGTASGPEPREIIQMPLVLAETLLLLTSSLTAGLAILSLKFRKVKPAIIFLALTYVLGVAFLTIELSEFSTLLADGHGWSQSAFLSAFFVLVAAHGAHITVGLIWLITLIIVLARKGLTDKLQRQFTLFGLFWHFLDLVWIFIFSVVYLGGLL